MDSDKPSPLDRGQLPLELGHATSHARSDFLIGEGNALAFAHIASFPNWPGPLALIVGPPKAGKSHLARIFAEQAGARLPAPGDLEGLARSAGTGPLVLEDVDRPGYEEAALFHLLNQSMRDDRPILMTAREPVANWPYQTDDLRSRARLASLLKVALPDDIQLSQMFVKLYADRQVSVEPKVISYIVARMERSPAEVVALADLTDRLALARGTAITRAVAAESLAQRGFAQLELNLEGEDDE